MFAEWVRADVVDADVGLNLGCGGGGGGIVACGGRLWVVIVVGGGMGSLVVGSGRWLLYKRGSLCENRPMCLQRLRGLG